MLRLPRFRCSEFPEYSVNFLESDVVGALRDISNFGL